MTFGRYREGDGLAWRLDPRTKMAFVLALVVATFAAGSPWQLAMLVVVAALAHASSGMGMRDAASTLRPFAWLMAFVLAFNALYASAGLAYGLACVVRFAVVLVGTSALMVTTTPTELADGVTLLVRPLARLGVPADDLGLAVGMTLRFVPVVMEEFERVRDAQLGRHARLGSGGLVARVRSYVPALVPTFASALRRSRRLAFSLEMRGYGLPTSRGRTCVRAYRLGRADACVLCGCALMLARALA